jgi:hypothetical protein
VLRAAARTGHISDGWHAPSDLAPGRPRPARALLTHLRLIAPTASVDPFRTLPASSHLHADLRK